MPNSPLLTVAIISYNSHHVIQQCMHDLMLQSKYRVLIVDNASNDESVDSIKRLYPNIELIQLDRNIGYGRAANRAIKAITTPYLLLINPDLSISENAIDRLLERMAELDGKTAILAPAVSPKDHLNQGLLSRSWVIGAAMLLNLELLSQIGFFDENIFLFSEETDLCYRARAQGLQINLDSDLYVHHLSQQSSTPDASIEYLKNWHIGWSHMYFYTKHHMAHGKKNPLRVMCLYAVKYIAATNKIKRLQYKARLKGTVAFIRGQKAFLPDGRPQALS